MSYTVQDKLHVDKYVENWIIHDTIEMLYKKYPHIISHLTYDIRYATENDFYYPEDLIHSMHPPIIVTTKIDQKLCEELISCNPQTKSGPCTQLSKAQRYPVGDDGKKDISCQPSCFNLFKKHQETGNQKQLSLTYHNNQCVIIDPSVKAFMELPHTRSTQPQNRITDLPCGFNRSDHENPYSYSGIRYHYNKKYCDSFFDEFDAEKKLCYVHWSNKYIGNVILGEYIIKSCQALDQYIRTGSDLPENMMKFEDVEPDSIYTLENWLKNINNSFVSPTVKVNELKIDLKNNSNIKQEESFIKGNSRIMDNLHKPKTEINLDTTTRRKLEKEAKEYSKESKRTKRSAELNSSMIFEGLLRQLSEADIYEDLGLNIAADVGVLLTKKLLETLYLKLAGHWSAKITSETIFKISLYQGLTRAAKALALKTASKLMLGLLKLMVSALTIVGILLNVFLVFDLILLFVDPLHLNNKYPDDYLDNSLFSSEYNFRQQTGMIKPVLTFKILSNFLMTQEELTVLYTNAVKYDSEYFNHLHVNSEGSVIDHGKLISFEKFDINLNDYDFIKLRLYSQEDLYKYEIDHMTRIKIVDKIKKINYYFTGVLIISLVFQYFLFIIIIMIVICVLAYVQYLALGLDDISNIAYYFA